MNCPQCPTPARFELIRSDPWGWSFLSTPCGCKFSVTKQFMEKQDGPLEELRSLCVFIQPPKAKVKTKK